MIKEDIIKDLKLNKLTPIEYIDGLYLIGLKII